MILKKIKEKKQKKIADRKLALEKLKDAEEKMALFAEGKMSTYEFWELYKSDENIGYTLLNDSAISKKERLLYFPKYYENNPFGIVDINIDNLYHRTIVYATVCAYFNRRNISLNFHNKDCDIYIELASVTPQYADTDSLWFFENVLDKCEFSLGTKERKIWLKNKIREVFRYENKPPRWLQNPEWPIGENGPLLFKKQSAHPNFLTDDYIDYYFDDAGKEVVVRQYD